MDKFSLCKRIVRQPGFGYDLTPEQMDLIGYLPNTDPHWPSYQGIVQQAAEVLRQAGFDLTKPALPKISALPTL